MPRRPDLPSTKRNVQVYDEDWQFLSERYGVGGVQPVGVGPLIREIIHRKVREIRAREQQGVDALQTLQGEFAK